MFWVGPGQVRPPDCLFFFSAGLFSSLVSGERRGFGKCWSPPPLSLWRVSGPGLGTAVLPRWDLSGPGLVSAFLAGFNFFYRVC